MTDAFEPGRGREPDPAAARRRTLLSWLRRLGIVAVIVFAAHMDLRTWNSIVDALFDSADGRQPLTVAGAPVVSSRDGAVTVYLLTTRVQRHRPRRWGLSRLSRTSELQVDLWAFDGATAQPRWHRRVSTQPGAAPTGVSLFGVDGGTIWLYAHGLQARSVDDGEAIVDAPAAIVEGNPELAGQLVADARYYGVDGAGLWLTGADGRQWRVPAGRFVAQPVATAPAAARDDVVMPRPWLAAAQTAFVARGIDIGERWLGVLTDAEAAQLSRPLPQPDAATGTAAAAAKAQMAAVRALDDLPVLHQGQRYRLWQARIERRSAAPPDWPADFPDNWGTYRHYTAFSPLPDAPTFLGGGLLDPSGRRAPAWLREPDSVFVLDRDRLGENGRLRLARIAGPRGNVVWRSPLPLSLLQAASVEGAQAVLFGRAFAAIVDDGAGEGSSGEEAGAQPVEAGDATRSGAADGGRDEPYHAAHERLVAVDLAAGIVRSFDLTRDAPALLDAAADAAGRH